MWRDFEKEKSLGHRSVPVQVGVEMSKIKKLEKEIQDLKDLVLQLQSTVIALQARGPFVISPQPLALPQIQTTPPNTMPWIPDRPYIGDPPPGTGPTITCGTKSEVSGCSNQISRCC